MQALISLPASIVYRRFSMINIPGGKVSSTEIYGSYTVVLSPTAAEGDALPDGGVEVKGGDQTYVKIGDI